MDWSWFSELWGKAGGDLLDITFSSIFGGIFLAILAIIIVIFAANLVSCVVFAILSIVFRKNLHFKESAKDCGGVCVITFFIFIFMAALIFILVKLSLI